VLLSIGESELDRIRQARAIHQGRAWKADAAPSRVILDFDATPISIHSEKERAAGHYKGGFGFNPLLASFGREVLARVLRPGNAGATAPGAMALLAHDISPGHSSCCSTASTRSQNPSGCAIASFTSPGQITRHARRWTLHSPPTGPGRARSCGRSSA
jgi:hypothetical protein